MKDLTPIYITDDPFSVHVKALDKSTSSKWYTYHLIF